MVFVGCIQVFFCGKNCTFVTFVFRLISSPFLSNMNEGYDTVSELNLIIALQPLHQVGSSCSYFPNVHPAGGGEIPLLLVFPEKRKHKKIHNKTYHLLLLIDFRCLIHVFFIQVMPDQGNMHYHATRRQNPKLRIWSRIEETYAKRSVPNFHYVVMSLGSKNLLSWIFHLIDLRWGHWFAHP